MNTETTVAQESKKAKSIELSKKAIAISVVIVLALVVLAYILTFILPTGQYQRDVDGAIIEGTYQQKEMDGIAWWQFLLSPFMILSPATPGFGTVWAILILLFVIGAIFTALDESGILIYMVESLARRFGKKRYILLFLLPFTFMFLGSTAGMFEELIPLVPVVIMLCYAMGWDALTGLAISILAGCFGFAAGVVNPFTVGVAQSLGGIVMFSGIGLRLLTFAIAYVIIMTFIIIYVKKIEKKPSCSAVYLQDLKRKKEFNFQVEDFKYDKNKSKALIWFTIWLLLVVFIALLSVFVHAIADYVMYITIVIYLIAGLGACIICNLKGMRLLKQLGKGAATLFPAVAMILVAGGIRYIIEEGDIMDTILYNCVKLIQGNNPFVSILIIYAIIFLFEMFIPSGSAKAFLLMPMIFSICQLMNINGQIAVLAFAFADGFANVILPTNAGLLLILGLTTVDYGKWFKWSFKIQFTLLIATIGILALAY
ncbi:MAG TPA: hypothetical protein VJ903_02205, partial [Clostridia bacterium]|nr:hypothetical protein [Clostridia bacterium]